MYLLAKRQPRTSYRWIVHYCTLLPGSSHEQSLCFVCHLLQI